MKHLNFPSAKSIVVSGDIHGDFNQLIFKMCVQYQMRDTLLIVAGDCGFGFYNRSYYEDMAKRNSKRLSEANNWIVFVRGNHDNPAYFDGHIFNHRRLMAIPDYTIIQACRHTILCVGGGISIDRRYRLDKWEAEQMKRRHQPDKEDRLTKHYYWADEAPIYDDSQLTEINEKFAIDTVITHTAPSFCELQNKNFLMQFAHEDATLLDDVHNERATMDALYDRLRHDAHPLRHWYYGHFHQSWHIEMDGVMFSMLDVMELGEVRSNLSEFPTSSLIDSVVAKFTTTATDGKTYKIDYYNLDVNIASAINKEKRMCMHIRSLYPPQMRE